MTIPVTHAPYASEGSGSSLGDQLAGPLGSFLQHRVLPGWLPARRWFRSKSRPLAGVTFEAVFPCDHDPEGNESGSAILAILRVDFTDDDGSELYLLPLALTDLSRAEGLPEAAVLGHVATPDGERLLIDASWHEGFRARLFDVLMQAEEVAAKNTDGGFIRGLPVSATDAVKNHASRADARHGVATSRVLSAEQSNTALVYGADEKREDENTEGDAPLFVKLYRRLEDGVHPEPEMLRFLSERTSFRHAPAFASALEWTDDAGRVFTAALAQEFLPGAKDAWGHVLTILRTQDGLGDSLRATAALLGRSVAEFHRAVGAEDSAPPPAFAPETFTPADAGAARNQARTSLDEGLEKLEQLLRERSAEAPPALRAAFPQEARTLLAARATLARRLDDAYKALAGAGDGAHGGEGGLKIRTHGDLHLGQILLREEAGKVTDARILDFEGEPGRPLAAARIRQSPLRDVAGMLRSFHYAAHAARLQGAGDEKAPFDPEMTAAALREAFLDSYFNTLAGTAKNGVLGDAGALLPGLSTTRQALLDIFILEKAAYELRYECDNRPDWVLIPVKGLLSLCRETAHE